MVAPLHLSHPFKSFLMPSLSDFIWSHLIWSHVRCSRRPLLTTSFATRYCSCSIRFWTILIIWIVMRLTSEWVISLINCNFCFRLHYEDGNCPCRFFILSFLNTWQSAKDCLVLLPFPYSFSISVPSCISLSLSLLHKLILFLPPSISTMIIRSLELSYKSSYSTGQAWSDPRFTEWYQLCSWNISGKWTEASRDRG